MSENKQSDAVARWSSLRTLAGTEYRFPGFKRVRDFLSHPYRTAKALRDDLRKAAQGGLDRAQARQRLRDYVLFELYARVENFIPTGVIPLYSR